MNKVLSTKVSNGKRSEMKHVNMSERRFKGGLPSVVMTLSPYAPNLSSVWPIEQLLFCMLCPESIATTIGP